MITIEKRVVEELNPSCAIVYAVISGMIQEGGKNAVLLSTRQLTNKIGCLSYRTVYRALNTLVKEGYISKEKFIVASQHWYKLLR